MTTIFLTGMVMAIPPWGMLVPKDFKIIGTVIQLIGLIILIVNLVSKI